MIRFIIKASGYVRHYYWIGMVLLLAMVFEGWIESATRFSFGYLIDNIIATRNEYRLFVLIMLMSLAAALLMGLCFVGDYLWARLGALLLNVIRQQMLSNLQTLSIGYFSATPSGDLLSRFISDACAIETSFVSVVPYLIVNLANALFSFLFMISIHPILALSAILGALPAVFAPRLLSRKATRASIRMREVQGRVSSRLQEITQSQSIIKAFSLEKEFENRFLDESGQLLRAATRANFLVYLSQRIPTLLFFILSLIILSVSAGMTMKGILTLGDVISFQVLLLGLNSAITNMTWIAPLAIDGLASMERIEEVLRELPDLKDPESPVPARPLMREIRFSDVSFGYAPRANENPRTVLNELSFAIQKGDFVLIAGASGSGKTSILMLMLRLYDPVSGKITFDGYDLPMYDSRSLRTMYGFVGQEAVLFDGTIRDNIRLGKLEATDQEIWDALTQAEIADMVMSLPDGLDTLVGERGSFLSGGQRQRLSLARALVRRPSVLLLDEATSALDNSSEAALLETLRHISRDTDITIIAVSHRMSFSNAANHIIVLRSDGVIDDQGTHMELLEREGFYSTLWKCGHSVQPFD